ncbi:MAG: sodium:glutamate symporter [Oscillospiraceae bacterium]|nr:sodium:glutamate symporter [Oscillospiraceae bacterium]
MSVNDFLLDFAVASVFILLGQLIRAKVKFVQRFFIPASMLAGFMGLTVRYLLPELLPISGSIGSYPTMLIMIIFASVGINGFSMGKGGSSGEVARMSSYLSYKMVAQVIQYGLVPAFSILVISQLWPEINYGFGLLLAAGFSGGHGTAAAVGSSFANLGFADAPDLGQTCATVGILAGVFGGMLFIKLGTKRGWTKYIQDFSYLSGDLKTGLVPAGSRAPLGEATLSSVVLDPLAWHFAILLVAAGAGRLLYKFFYDSFGFDGPSYLYSFLVALVMFAVFKQTGVDNYIDHDVTSRISGTCTDYLVFFGITSINLGVIVKYAMPLVLLLLFGIFVVVITLLYFGPAMNKGSWFERSLFVFGYSTGVFAIGFILLRIVDPENKSLTLNDTAFACIFTTFSELFTWSFGPIMLLNGQHWLFIGIQLAIMTVCLIVNLVMKWWWIKEPLDRPAVGLE